MERETGGEVLKPELVDMIENLYAISRPTVGRYVPDLIATIRDLRHPQRWAVQELCIEAPWREPPRLLRPVVERFGKDVRLSAMLRMGDASWARHRLTMRVFGPWAIRRWGNG